MTAGNPRQAFRIDDGQVGKIPIEEGPGRVLTEAEIDQALDVLFAVSGEKGGAGSGHHDHAGIPGHHGGSLPGSGSSWAHHGGQRDPAGFAESDPEYFDFMWSILKERT